MSVVRVCLACLVRPAGFASGLPLLGFLDFVLCKTIGSYLLHSRIGSLLIHLNQILSHKYTAIFLRKWEATKYSGFPVHIYCIERASSALWPSGHKAPVGVTGLTPLFFSHAKRGGRFISYIRPWGGPTAGVEPFWSRGGDGHLWRVER